MKIKVMLAAAMVAAIGFVACEKQTELMTDSNFELNNQEKSFVNNQQYMEFSIPSDLLAEDDENFDLFVVDLGVNDPSEELFDSKLIFEMNFDGKLRNVKVSYKYSLEAGFDEDLLNNFPPTDDVERTAGPIKGWLIKLLKGTTVCSRCNEFGFKTCVTTYAGGRTRTTTEFCN